MGHARLAVRKLRLHLTEEGGAELLAGTDQLWASDSDDEFLEEFGTEILDENDLDEILEYLVDSGHMTSEEADRTECTGEVLRENAADEEELEVEDSDADEDDWPEGGGP